MPKKEMTIEDLRRELRAVFQKVDELEKLEGDEKLKEVFSDTSPAGMGMQLADLISTMAAVKVLLLVGEYFGLPPGAVSLPKKEAV